MIRADTALRFSRKHDEYCQSSPEYFRLSIDSMRASTIGLYPHCRVVAPFAVALSLDRMFRVAERGGPDKVSHPGDQAAERIEVAAAAVLCDVMMSHKRFVVGAMRENTLRQFGSMRDCDYPADFAAMDRAREVLHATGSIARADASVVARRVVPAPAAAADGEEDAAVIVEEEQLLPKKRAGVSSKQPGGVCRVTDNSLVKCAFPFVSLYPSQQ